MGQPYTVSFGPWAPDLENVGVQMPFQWSATSLPVADCLNVYYQDGAYRSLPGPASIGPSVGVPIMNAANWYDNSTGKESLFAASANGVYSLTDGSWSQLVVQTNALASAIGQAILISLGVPGYIVCSVTPGSQSLNNTASSEVFSAEAATAYPSASAYTWSFPSASGGTWSAYSGQSTASFAAQVTGVTALQTATATLEVTATINGSYYTASSALSYRNSTPIQHIYYNQGIETETIPTGAQAVVIEVWGGGGNGGKTYYSGAPNYILDGGGGGGAGGYARSSYTLSSGNWGQTMAVSATGQNTCTVSSGTYSLTTMQGNLAGNGVDYGAGGAGGLASGGNVVNTTGAAGGNGGTNQAPGSGGVGTSGIYLVSEGGGGNGGIPTGGVTAGANGALAVVSFYYT